MKAIVLLTRGYQDYTHYGMLIRRNKHIEYHLQDKNIDILIFHEGNIYHQEDIMRETPSLRIQFIDIKKDGLAFEKDMEKIPVDKDTAMFGYSYRHMCSFWFVDFWHFVKGYDEIIRIDEDCYILFDPTKVFEQLNTHVMVCGFYGVDEPFVTKGLNDHTEAFMKKRGLPFEPKSPGGPYTNLCGFSLKKIQKYPIIGEYIHSVQESNRIYSHRWGDLPLWGEVIHYLLGPTSLKVDKSIVYYHGSHDIWVNKV